MTRLPSSPVLREIRARSNQKNSSLYRLYGDPLHHLESFLGPLARKHLAAVSAPLRRRYQRAQARRMQHDFLDSLKDPRTFQLPSEQLAQFLSTAERPEDVQELVLT